MSIAETREIQMHAANLKQAMRVMGQILIDVSLQPWHRMERCLGILAMYECAPQVTTAPRDTGHDAHTRSRALMSDAQVEALKASR